MNEHPSKRVMQCALDPGKRLRGRGDAGHNKAQCESHQDRGSMASCPLRLVKADGPSMRRRLVHPCTQDDPPKRWDQGWQGKEDTI